MPSASSFVNYSKRTHRNSRTSREFERDSSASGSKTRTSNEYPTHGFHVGRHRFMDIVLPPVFQD